MNERNVFQLIVSAEQAGQRLDKLLSGLDFVASRSRAAWLIDHGLVQLKGKVLKAAYKAQAHDQIQIELPDAPPTRLQPLDAPLEILFQDEALAVINKPSGLVVHPAAGHAQDTLVNILLHHLDHLAMGFAENRPGIVHRLDRDTSGVLVVAKNDHAHRNLAEQFRNKTALRFYWALVHGVPRTKTGKIVSNLARHRTDRKRFASSTVGKSAVTHFKVLQSRSNSVSWLQLKLETGRTHQIRVHLSEQGFPILGDPIYGGKNKKLYDTRLALHACELGFVHPVTQERLHFRVDWPEELLTLAKRLGFDHV